MKLLFYRFRAFLYYINLSAYKVNIIALIALLLASLSAYSQDISLPHIEVQNLQTEAEQLSKKWNLKSIKSSTDKYLQAAENWEKLNVPHNQINCLIEAGRLNLIAGNSNQTLNFLNKSLTIAKRHNLNAEISVILAEMSKVALGNGQTEQSRKLINKALLLDLQISDHSGKALLYFCAGDFFYNQRDIKKSVEFYSKSIDISVKNGDLKSLATAQLFLGYARLFQNEYDAALDLFKTALANSQTAQYERGEGLTYIAIGNLFSSTDAKQSALEFYQKAEKIFPDDLDFVDRARLLNGIGSVYEDYNELDLSISYRKKALSGFGKANYKYGQLATLSRLGSLYRIKNEPVPAIENLNLSRKLAVELKDALYLAITAEEFGNLYFQMGQFQKALENYQPALQYFQKTQNIREISLISGKIGQIYYQQNNLWQSRFFFDSALELNKKLRNKFDLAQTLHNLALLDKNESKTKNGLKNIENSLNVTNSLYYDVTNSKLKQTYLSNVYDRYELYVNLLMKIHKESPNENHAIEALQAAEKSKARVMLENLALSEANFTKDADAETVQREKEIRVLLNAKADKLTDLLSRNAEKSETDKISGEINELENELENIKAQLKQNSPVYSAIKNPAPFDVAEFQREVLDDDSLLLEFSLGADESYLWLVGKNEFNAYVLPPREEIEADVEALRGLLKERGLKTGESVEDFQQRIREAETDYAAVSKNLSRKLFGQIADKIGRKRLIIVPDGELHYFPVAALPLPDSASDEPILLTNETVYVPSAQTLAVLSKSRKQTAATKNLLVFSDPIFTPDDARFAPENKPDEHSSAETAQAERFRFVESLNNLPRLAASKDESETIVEIVGAPNTDNYSGFAATRENLLNLKTGDYKILHFATHGLTDEKRPELSGIVLSRYDEKGAKLDEFFRIQDIYALDLNADLVVLSACETGIGKEVKGEGLMSLNNAFLQTGAKSVVSSLWKVEDGATLELMRNFYGAMANDGLTPSQALRRAQIKLRENPQYKSPFYWAAFTVQGDFRNVPQISRGDGFWIYSFAVLPLALVGIYLYRRRRYSTAKP